MAATSTPPARASQNSGDTYLFTFLGALFLLLILGSSLVLRSYYCARPLNFHNIESVIVDGAFFMAAEVDAEIPPRIPKQRPNKKPTLFEVHICSVREAIWTNFMPIAAQPIKIPPLQSSLLRRERFPVQVTVLVAMPQPSGRIISGSSFPIVELGIAQLAV
ncbi:hypothetical protein C8J56DRAFT_1156857 [Mycena floridula]|nr:hypothetical protein C8J56DRAFT_1156857 [Mycena floridula]